MPVPCIVVIFALLSPRLALIVTALLTNVLSRAFDSWVVPLIGFFILPWTTLAFAWMWDSGHHVRGLEWFLVGAAFVIDMGSYAGSRRR